MYCGSCREERLGTARFCIACGAQLQERSLEDVEAELSHVQWLLAQLPRWDIKESVREYLEERYRRVERLLLASILERKPHASAASATAAEPPLTLIPPVEAAAPVEPAADAEPAPSVPEPPREEARSEAQEVPAPAEAAAVPAPLSPLPEIPAQPLFDVPREATPTRWILEEASTWSRIWKPFLYESIGWFIGGFLILAGTFYFVAESWAGMTSLARSLLVFGVTAGYTAGFRLWGGLLSRKETLAGAGRILELIGAAAAPLTALALQPMADEHPALLLPFAAVAALGAAFLARRPAEAFGAPSPRLVQGLTLLATAMLGLAPLLAGAGPRLLWLNALPAFLFWRAMGARAVGADERRSRVFALAAPAWLVLLFALPLHLALVARGHAPALGSYAPFLAVVVGSALRSRTLDEERAADALGVAVAALQLACVVLSASGEAPAFFVTSAVATFTLWSLSLGAPPRVRWLYGAYVAGYLAYQSAGQLVPGPLMELLVKVEAALGYGGARKLPFSFDAVYALPYVLAGVAWALRLRRQARTTLYQPERLEAVAELLLRATAGASALLMALAMSGGDPRPALWTVPALAAVCTALGLWLDRRYLTWTGVGGAALLPFFTVPLMGRPAAAILCGAVGLLYGALACYLPKKDAHGRSLAALWLGLAASALAWWHPLHLAGVPALLLAAGGAWLVARGRDEERLRLWSTALATSAVPLAFLIYAPGYAPLALAVAGLAVAVLSDRVESLWSLWWVALGAHAVAACWQVVLLAQASDLGLPLPATLGPVLLLGFVSASLYSRWDGRFGVPGALFLGLALLPPTGFFVPWSWLPPAASVGLYAAVSLAASAWTARRGPSLAASWYAGVSLAGTLIALVPVGSHDYNGPWLFSLGALGALAASRALTPFFCIPWAALLAMVDFVPAGQVAWLALPFTALALLDELPELRGLLFGPRRIGTVASLCALLVSAVGTVAPGMLGIWPSAALLLGLPLLWVRASRRPVFAAGGGLLLLALIELPGISGQRTLHEVLWLIPAWAVLVTRLTWHLPLARRLLLGDDAEPRADRLQLWILGSLVPCALAIASLEGREGHPLVAAFALALMLGAGEQLPLRLVAAAVLAAEVPEARVAAMGALLVVGLACHHFPARAGRWLGSGEHPYARGVAAVLALGLAFLHVALGMTGPALLLAAGVTFVCAFLLSRPWLLAMVPLLSSLALLGDRHQEGAPWLSGATLPALVALGAAGLAAASRVPAVRVWLEKVGRWLGPGFDGEEGSVAGWVGAALATVFPLGLMLLREVPVAPGACGLLALAAVALMVARAPWQAATASALLGWAVWMAFPPVWAPVGVAVAGVALCLAGHLLHERFEVAPTLHHAGWVLALLSLAGLSSLGHPATPLCVALCVAAAWIASWRQPTLEPAAWLGSLIWLHVLMLHLGVVFSTGKPPGYVFPYLALASSLCAAGVLLLPHRADRRWVGLAFAAVALLEAVGGLATIGQQAPREAFVCVGGLLALFAVLVRTAAKRRDELPAHLAQVALALGYLVVRLHGMGAPSLGGGDSLAALVAGVLFSGLYVWTRRQGEALEVFVRPALVGAFLLPLVGLLAAPWREPLVTAALLVGHAAHFCALATQEGARRTGSLLAAVAFNAALALAWLGTGAGEPQYYVIPAGLSVLVLVRVFQDDLSELAQARLRAVAITAIYAAGAWRPLMFGAGWALALCAFLCVVGIAAGVALRIRSYVYLGTAFLVTSVVANLVRYGARDHRLGALFLSGLGLLVVAFMVVVTSRKAELMQRYDRVREMLEGWEG